MKAIIMAGGEGKRLKPVTGGLPKPMVPLLGKPLMERIVELLRSAGIRDICATLKYNPQPITEYFGDGGRFGVRMQYRIEGEAMGTAGGVKNCADFYGKEDFLVISGDAACSFDLNELIRKHRTVHPAVTMALYSAPEPLQYGLVLPEEDGSVRCFIEKPGWERVVTDLVNTGIYVVSPRAMDHVPEKTVFDFAKDLFPLLLENNEKICGKAMDGYWCDVGTPRSYFHCCLDALDGILPLPDVCGDVGSAKAEAHAPLSGGAHSARHIPCKNRARLMRAMSETLMECGAEFSDGLTLQSPNCALRVCPCAEESALEIETTAHDAEFSEELAASLAAIAESFDF